jgi:uncharacterized protein YkwD
MNQKSSRNYRPAGNRPTPSRRTPRPAPRPARPSHIAQRQSRGSSLALGLAALVLLLAAGSIIVWQVRRADNAEQAASRAIAAVETAQAAPTATVTLVPTPTRELAASGAVPGGAASTPVGQPTDDAATIGASTPAAASTAASQRLSTQGATPAQPAAATPSAPSDDVPGASPDFAALAQRMLELVNADRVAAGLVAVAWDPLAAQAGQDHAKEMADLGYMSHWNLDGYGPEHRYSFAGGLDFVQENVYRLVHRWADGSGAPIEDWEKVMADAQAALMDSPGHRANIMAPEHTHLGVGIAYRADTGTVSIAQEFTNRYVQVEPLPQRARPGDRIILRGTLLPGSTDPLVNVAYEPFPAPMTLDALNQTGTYSPRAQHLAVPPVQVGADGRFVSEYTLDAGAAPGLYHVLVWVATAAAGERVPALDAVIEVQP